MIFCILDRGVQRVIKVVMAENVVMLLWSNNDNKASILKSKCNTMRFTEK